MDHDTFIARIHTLRRIIFDIPTYEYLEKEYGISRDEYDSDQAFIRTCIYNDGAVTAANMKRLNVLYNKYTINVKH